MFSFSSNYVNSLFNLSIYDDKMIYDIDTMGSNMKLFMSVINTALL